MSSLLFIDIETAETTDADIIQDIADNIKPPGNIKKQESIDKWISEKKPDAAKEAVSKTSFDGLAGSIICIGFAVNNEPVQSVSRDIGESESEMLYSFWQGLVGQYGINFNPLFCGHNICDFDLRFLFQRCVVNNIKPLIYLPHNEKPWGKSVYDTLYETMGLIKTGGSLDRIAKAFGLEGKLKGFDGSMVNQAWLDGDISKITTYCHHDVEVTRNIYKRLNFLDKVGS